MICELDANEDGSHALTLRNGFGTDGLVAGAKFVIKIGSGLITPISK